MLLLQLAAVCLRIGTFVFGGGLVFIPMMQADVVDRYHWLTRDEFVSAVALGQMTPGPILVSATFVGYKIGGLAGAFVATFCIFLPSFIMTLIAAQQLSRLQRNTHVSNFLWGVRAAVVGLVVAAALQMAHASCREPAQMLLVPLALAALLWRKLDAGLVVITAGVLGLIFWS